MLHSLLQGRCFPVHFQREKDASFSWGSAGQREALMVEFTLDRRTAKPPQLLVAGEYYCDIERRIDFAHPAEYFEAACRLCLNWFGDFSGFDNGCLILHSRITQVD